jgi:membrane-associated phospholipid phosphatase
VRIAASGFVAALVLFAVEPDARAGCVEHPATEIAPRIAKLGQSRQVALLSGALAAPLLLGPTGGDWGVRTFYYRDLGAHYDAERISLTAPYALAGALAVGWGVAALEGDCASSAVANRAVQAVLFAAALQGALKLVVGRTYPASDPAHNLVDDGRAFHAEPFSALGAWPSGHAATTFAFAAAIRAALPRHVGILRYGGYVFATAVSAGMLLSDRHWTSDILSGALLGEAVGTSFGGEEIDAHARIMLTPTGIAGEF